MMKFIRHKDAAGRMPERGKRKGSLRGIPGLALALGVVLAAGGMGTRAYAWNLDPPGIEEDGELVTFPSTSGKENGTETEKGNDWTSGLEGGTTLAILSDGTSKISAGGHDLKPFLTERSITDAEGNPIEDNTLYVGKSYKIHLKFQEGGIKGGIQGQQFLPTPEGTLTYQIPKSFSVSKQENVPLEITGLDGKPVEIGTYSIDENGLLTIQLNEVGKSELSKMNDASLTFDMDATAQKAGGGDGSEDFNFGVGEDFTFKVTDQPRVSVDKEGIYAENPDKKGGTLTYTVKTTVEHGDVHDVVVEDVLTPPQTSAFQLEMLKNGDNPDVTVTVTRDGVTYTLSPGDYNLVPEFDSTNPYKKQTFKVELKENGSYNPLKEGDVLNVTYHYKANYVEGSTDVFWGNVENDATVTGWMPVENPDESGTITEATFEEKRSSNVEIYVVPPGNGIVCKTENFSEETRTLHYTLYTVVPKTEGEEKWNPLYIYDDMVVEYGGKSWYLPEFKDGDEANRRVKKLQVKAIDIAGGWNGSWGGATSEKFKELEELAEKAKLLTGYNINSDLTGYNPESLENYVYYYNDKSLYIIFGAGKEELENKENYAKWGHWNHSEDRLIITEYDLDMSDETLEGAVTLEERWGSEKKTLKPSEVLLAGIKNTVNLRFSNYNPGYSVFFNNAEKMNKTGKLNKEDNTITWTVTMNTTDSTVNRYLQDVTYNWLGDAISKYGWGNMEQAYEDSMQAVFYDELPDGWEYVEGSLTATACDSWGNESSYPYDNKGFLELVTQVKDKRVIRAPLMFFYNTENTDRPDLFNWFGNELASLTFTYKLKATDKWLEKYAAGYDEAKVHNYAAIVDKKMKHWEKDADVSYIPAMLTKVAEHVGTSNLLKFTLEVNPKGKDLDPYKDYLIVIDESKNLEIQPDSIKVLYAAGGELKKKDPVTEADFVGENEWGILPVEAPSDPEAGKQFKIMVPDGKALKITYEANIPEKGENVPVSNKARIDGVTKTDATYEGALKVDEIHASGDGNTYELTIKKIDSSDSTKELQGAEFKFYIVQTTDGGETEETKKEESGGGGKELKEKETEEEIKVVEVKIGEKEYTCRTADSWKFTTDENGSYKIGGDENWWLSPGNYYILEETKAPAGYNLLEKPIIFYYGFSDGMEKDKYPGVIAVSSGELTITDPPVPYELPETGGFGTAYLYLMGSVFVLMGGAFLLYGRRLAHRRTDG